MKLPSKATLKKYGLSETKWIEMYDKYDGRCWICFTYFDGRDRDNKPRLACVDHKHVKNYKKLPPEEKVKYVRGMLCFQCNRLVAQKSNTPLKLINAADYLLNYKKARNS